MLAGGRGSRLGGVDKALLVVDGRTLLERVLDAVGGAAEAVVVGPRRDVPGVGPVGVGSAGVGSAGVGPVGVGSVGGGLPRVRWAREDPPGGGPVAGLAAGLRHVRTDLVVVLAVDQPGLTRSTVDRLVAAVAEAGAVLVDEGDRPQWLTGAWRADRLRAALPADPRDASVRSVLDPLRPVLVPAEPGEARDVDTPADL